MTMIISITNLRSIMQRKKKRINKVEQKQKKSKKRTLNW